MIQLHTYIYPFLYRFFSQIGCYRILMEFSVLYIGSLIIICCIYNIYVYIVVYVYVHPNLLIYPPPFPFGNYMFVFYVSQFCLLFVGRSHRAGAMPWLPLFTGLVVWGGGCNPHHSLVIFPTWGQGHSSPLVALAVLCFLQLNCVILFIFMTCVILVVLCVCIMSKMAYPFCSICFYAYLACVFSFKCYCR